MNELTVPAARAALLAAAAALLGACEQSAQESASAVAASGGAYTVPRTPWGDPDLQGKWPSTDMVGVPLQRDVEARRAEPAHRRGVREREARAARQTEQDNADFDIDEREVEQPRGDGRRPGVAAAALARARQAAAPGVADRRSAGRPDAAADAEAAQQRQAALRKARERPRPGRLLHRPQPLRSLHHARRRGLDAAGDLQQRQPDHSGAGLRRDRATR